MLYAEQSSAPALGFVLLVGASVRDYPGAFRDSCIFEFPEALSSGNRERQYAACEFTRVFMQKER